jgi:NAD(P)-dependent dehydrogenase (short-subunit alcohol dehydrogenase family)
MRCDRAFFNMSNTENKEPKHKIAVVTGSHKGIGFAIAKGIATIPDTTVILTAYVASRSMAMAMAMARQHYTSMIIVSR